MIRISMVNNSVFCEHWDRLFFKVDHLKIKIKHSGTFLKSDQKLRSPAECLCMKFNLNTQTDNL